MVWRRPTRVAYNLGLRVHNSRARHL